MISAVLVRENQPDVVWDMTQLRAKKTRDEVKQRQWKCKICGREMIPRLGHIRSWYFAHKRDASACPFEAESERESHQHRELKRAAGEALRAYFGAEVQSLEYEVRFPEIRRIADAVITLRDGARVAVEAQLSPLTLQQLQDRTHSYLRDEIELVWVFQETDQGGLKAGGLWDTCREWLLDEGYLVLTARATTVQTSVPLPQLPGPG